MSVRVRDRFRVLLFLPLVSAGFLPACGSNSAEPPTSVCGDNVVTAPEQCDGTSVAGASCESLGLGTGQVSCSVACVLDTSGCSGSACDACTRGAEHCNGAVVEVCQAGASGCAAWTLADDCAAQGRACSESGASAQCVEMCSDQCGTIGDTRCSGSALQECRLASGGCQEWTTAMDCSAAGQICADAGGASCVAACSDQCVRDMQRCNGTATETCRVGSSGCLEWVWMVDCATSGRLCNDSSGLPVCEFPTPIAEDCGSAVALNEGLNTVSWSATKQDYLTQNPSCLPASVGAPVGPDVVMSYTAPVLSKVLISIAKPAGEAWTAVVSEASCGTPSLPGLCMGDDPALADLSGSFWAVAGKTYYLYASDASPAGAVLANPLSVDVYTCALHPFGVASTLPADGGSLPTTGSVSVEFSAPIRRGYGTIKVLGTALSYTFALKDPPPAGVQYSQNDKVVTVTPPVPLPAGQLFYIQVDDALDDLCLSDMQPDRYVSTFTAQVAPCVPGSGGMLGNTFTTGSLAPAVLPAAIDYAFSDNKSGGDWYFGTPGSVVSRIPRSGSSLQQVFAGSNLGLYGVAAGNEFFVSSSLKNAGVRVYRISKDGGQSFAQEGYANVNLNTGATLRGLAIDGTELFALASGSSAGSTQIYGMATGAGSQVNASLKRAPALLDCGDLLVDRSYFYLACAGGTPGVYRENRVAFPSVARISDVPVDGNTRLAMQDLDNDGVADVVYASSFSGTGSPQLVYICGVSTSQPVTTSMGSLPTPALVGPLHDKLANELQFFEPGTSSYVRVR